MNAVAIIPARMASTRFPGKPMAPILGIPMIGHVFERTKLSRGLADVYVATCDREIHDYIVSIGGKAVMTSDSHERCSDRTAEALLGIEELSKKQVEVAVMVQGDEPLILPEMIEAALKPFAQDTRISIVCLMAKCASPAEAADPNLVKVVTDAEGFALYFSREVIPSKAKWDKERPLFKQVPIIPFTRKALLRFTEQSPTPLERIESVDLLRALEHGDRVKMIETTASTQSVDTPTDLARVEIIMKDDTLFASYGKTLVR